MGVPVALTGVGVIPTRLIIRAKIMAKEQRLNVRFIVTPFQE
jgi:hypothetical protein